MSLTPGVCQRLTLTSLRPIRFVPQATSSTSNLWRVCPFGVAGPRLFNNILLAARSANPLECLSVDILSKSVFCDILLFSVLFCLSVFSLWGTMVTLVWKYCRTNIWLSKIKSRSPGTWMLYLVDCYCLKFFQIIQILKDSTNMSGTVVDVEY